MHICVITATRNNSRNVPYQTNATVNVFNCQSKPTILDVFGVERCVAVAPPLTNLNIIFHMLSDAHPQPVPAEEKAQRSESYFRLDKRRSCQSL